MHVGDITAVCIRLLKRLPLLGSPSGLFPSATEAVIHAAAQYLQPAALTSPDVFPLLSPAAFYSQLSLMTHSTYQALDV